ncbi:MAG: hypothetical protein A3H59_02060 [Candidatus Jacksonbacteria bacterium RIFCSPLOWO2_02_FULL_43_9]|nr:MAG: hypothetical protein UV70_C0001G0055 [Parcubacteria group bacterium GW2011_GWA2_43_13]OGY69792.1 MAG: hypothetical protein A3B94_02775 [Candidatus Jacksonbacteria bacterium RIFCSPHIGHO2_02_FULL_43_10]OGY71607.1 MAG: hypothetical protein A2986_01710 [Candidatus Jacksonbacteria bacterium RIFCSPLOWO2_01_FULL_44_13]OGY74360.1 MAG: hypothetical protein A3H59_02060 [Candidatus Jacksonbacteria bacterium RIFCSPLOWO2_02_FULL_43_9]HAZ16603.1 hypothetical protein [Candidatus Jacksonbacteria bacter
MSQEFDILEQYVSQILKEADLGEVDVAFEIAYRQRLMIVIANRMGQEAIGMVPDDRSQEFQVLMQSQPKPQEIFAFFNDVVPDFQQKISGMLEEIKRDFLQKAYQLKQLKAHAG